MSGRSELVVYGIKNCDTMKKARAWLDGEGVSYRFHDYKAEGVDQNTLKRWIKAVGWEALLNKAGTTFRKLPDEAKADINEGRAITLMMEQPSLIKRPVAESGTDITVGFRPETYRARFG